MQKTTISVTEAARNFADCVNRAHYQNVTFVRLKNGSPVARLVPDNEKVCLGRELSDDEAAAWGQDLRSSRKAHKIPADKWR